MKKSKNNYSKIWIYILILLLQHKTVFMGNSCSGKRKQRGYRSISDNVKKIDLLPELHKELNFLLRVSNSSRLTNLNEKNFSRIAKLASDGFFSKKRFTRSLANLNFHELFKLGFGFNEAFDVIVQGIQNKNYQIRYSSFSLLKRLIENIELFENDFKCEILEFVFYNTPFALNDKYSVVGAFSLMAVKELVVNLKILKREILDQYRNELFRILEQGFYNKNSMTRYETLNILFEFFTHLEIIDSDFKSELFEVAQRYSSLAILDKDRFVRIRSFFIFERLVNINYSLFEAKRAVDIGIKDKDDSVRLLSLELNKIISSLENSFDVDFFSDSCSSDFED